MNNQVYSPTDIPPYTTTSPIKELCQVNKFTLSKIWEIWKQAKQKKRDHPFSGTKKLGTHLSNDGCFCCLPSFSNLFDQSGHLKGLKTAYWQLSLFLKFQSETTNLQYQNIKFQCPLSARYTNWPQ